MRIRRSPATLATKLTFSRKKLQIPSLRLLHAQNDTIGSASVLTALTVNDYLALVSSAYSKRGALQGQRDSLKTTSAMRIRDRMATDFGRGAILPPVVVGVLTTTEEVTRAAEWSSEDLRSLLENAAHANISIIDGMQRTTVLLEIQPSAGEREIRVEFWFSDATANLTYRMLVLNTGQVPWNLRRQIEVINASFIAELKKALRQRLDGIEIYAIDDTKRRFNPGEYQANDVVEMYLAFGLRKPQVDKESVLADQFSRLDMIEAVSDKSFFENFVKVFEQLALIDLSVSRLQPEENRMPSRNRRFDGGRSLFDSQPACVGFMAAAAQKIYGRPGTERPASLAKQQLQSLLDRCRHVLKKLDQFNTDQLRTFLDFGTLNEVLLRPAGKIGESDRNLFTEAFRLLFDEEVSTMTPCWRIQ